MGYTEPPTISFALPNQTGTGSYKFNEIVTGQTSGTTARVVRWNASTNILEVTNQDDYFDTGEYIVGQESGAEFMLNTYEDTENGFTSNEEIEVAADSGILDFSEQNPFGMP